MPDLKTIAIITLVVVACGALAWPSIAPFLSGVGRPKKHRGTAGPSKYEILDALTLLIGVAEQLEDGTCADHLNACRHLPFEGDKHAT